MHRALCRALGESGCKCWQARGCGERWPRKLTSWRPSCLVASASWCWNNITFEWGKEESWSGPKPPVCAVCGGADDAHPGAWAAFGLWVSARDRCRGGAEVLRSSPFLVRGFPHPRERTPWYDRCTVPEIAPASLQRADHTDTCFPRCGHLRSFCFTTVKKPKHV